MEANSLIGVIGGVLVCMLGLLISMVWDLKRDLKAMKDCVNSKQEKAECIRVMEKLEKDMKEWLE
jgi:hypothetical protein